MPTTVTLRNPGIAAFLLGVLGVLYRVVQLALGTPWVTHSDEATMGLMALHISQGKAFPVYFYGQHYMGALEAYLAAPLFWLFGPVPPALRAPNLIFYIAFCWLIYQLVSLLYTPWFAAATVGLFALGSDRVIANQLVSGGGYPELVPAVTALMLLAVRLSTRSSRIGYLAFGLISGLVLWDDWLGLTYVAAAGVLLAAFRWRELLGRAGAIMIGGVLVGALPLLIHDFSASPNHRLFAMFGALNSAGASDAATASLIDHLRGALLISTPIASGLCPVYECPTAVYGWWGIALPALLVLAGILAVLALRRLARQATGEATLAPDQAAHITQADRAARVTQAGRIALAVAGLLALATYVKNPASVLYPTDSARYLACVLVSVPAALWPLWEGAFTAGRAAASTRVTGLLRICVLGAVVLLSLSATFQAVAKTAEARQSNREQAQLIAALDAMGVHEVYTEYWVCNRLAFATTERIICATVSDRLGRAHDRTPGYREAVDAAAVRTYVFPRDSREGKAFQSYVDSLGGQPIAFTDVAQYRIYRPSAPIGVPFSDDMRK